MRTPRALAAGACCALLVLAGCDSSSDSTSTDSTSTSTSQAPVTATSSPTVSDAPGTTYYVSVGDSYAAGFEPTGPHSGHTTTNGFAYQVATMARARGLDLTVENFGCSGATTESILHIEGCPPEDLGPGAASYDGVTQAAAAEAFLSAHQGHIGLVTVSAGGNDITSCGASPDPIGCLTKQLRIVSANLATLLTGLRAAAGPDTPIVGSTYPDVLLAGLLSKDAKIRQLSTLSVSAFSSLVNPALKSAYQKVGARFVDVTAASGAYGPLTRTTRLAPYGVVPVPVARLCRLTYACQYPDIHPRPAGYALIARLVVGTLS